MRKRSVLNHIYVTEQHPLKMVAMIPVVAVTILLAIIALGKANLMGAALVIMVGVVVGAVIGSTMDKNYRYNRKSNVEKYELNGFTKEQAHTLNKDNTTRMMRQIEDLKQRETEANREIERLLKM